MRKLWIGIVAAAAGMASAVFPSGAGQHFGVAGDSIVFPVEASASGAAMGSAAMGSTASPDTRVEGFFAWGLAATATEDPTVRIDSFTGCLAISTPQGSDFGCVQEFRLPPTLTDPRMHEVVVEGSAPSERYPGTTLNFSLRFQAVGAPAPSAGHSISTEPGTLRVSLRAGLETTVIATGEVISSVVGRATVDGTFGRYGRGVVVDSCHYETQPCPFPGA